MTQIFLNYRSADEPYGVQLLDQTLSARFGDDVVFLASKSIEPGDDWEKRMLAAVAASAALLVVIGRNWLDATDAKGRRRLENPADFVRREIRAGLDLGKTVIPVRLGVPRLTADVLPEALRDLAGRQDVVIGFRKARLDIDDLAKKLRRQIPALREPPPATEPPAAKPPAAKPTIHSEIHADTIGAQFTVGEIHTETFNAGQILN